MSDTDKRIEFIDAAKGIGIILVVLGHLNSAEQPIRNFIYSFHMPLFFFLSGIFFKENTDFRTLLIKSVKTLLVPYFIFVALDAVVCLIDTGFDAENVMFVIKSRLLSATGLRLRIINLPIWFLFALFYIRILYYFACKSKITEVIIILTGVILVAAAKHLWYPPKCIYIVAMPCFIFYSLGYRMKKYVFNHGKGNPIGKEIVISCIAFALLWYLSNINDCVNIYSYKYGNAVLFYFNAVMGCVLTLALSLCLSRIRTVNTMLAYYGKNSVVVMVFHYYLCRILLPDVMSVTGMSEYLYSCPVQVISTVVIFLIMIPLISVSEKYLKGVFGK